MIKQNKIWKDSNTLKNLVNTNIEHHNLTIEKSEMIQNEPNKTIEKSEMIQNKPNETIEKSEMIQNEPNKTIEKSEMIQNEPNYGNNLQKILNRSELKRSMNKPQDRYNIYRNNSLFTYEKNNTPY